MSALKYLDLDTGAPALIFLHGTGHYLQLEVPEQVNAMLTQFIEKGIRFSY